jgi:hypothetical protein
MITYIPTYKENAAKQKEKDLIDAAETIKSSYSITVLPTVELAYSFMADAEGALRTSSHYNITRKLLKDARDKYDIYRHALDQVNKNKYGEEGALYFLDLTDSFSEVLKKDIKHFEEAIEKFLIKNGLSEPHLLMRVFITEIFFITCQNLNESFLKQTKNMFHIDVAPQLKFVNMDAMSYYWTEIRKKFFPDSIVEQIETDKACVSSYTIIKEKLIKDTIIQRAVAKAKKLHPYLSFGKKANRFI